MSGTKLTAVDTLPHLLPAKLPHPGRGWILLPFTGGLMGSNQVCSVGSEIHRLWEAELQYEPKFMSNSQVNLD